VSVSPRYRKAFRDLAERPGRSLLAVLAMAAGVFEIGAMLYAWSMLQPALTTMYERTLPSSATLTTTGVTDALVDSVRHVPGVADAEARPVVMARVRAGGGDWLPGVVYAVRDFDHQYLDLLLHEAGAWPPAAGDVLLERSALGFAHVKVGDRITLRAPGSEDISLRVAGTVHAAGLAPAWMEHMVPAFVAWDSPLRHSGEGESEQIRIVVAEHRLEEGWIRQVADSVAAMLVRRGHEVSRVSVPTPGKHPHADQMAAFLYLLGAFGLLSFLLGAVLTASMVHALLAEQVREVGILKAIGGTTRQVAGIYLTQVALLAGVALAVGIPAGIALGRAYARFSAGILNADIEHAPFPLGVLVAEVVVGLVVPLLVACIPVLRASRITVREALAGDAGTRAATTGQLERWLARVPGMSRPLLLSLRGTLQRRGRLVLSVVTLAVGGAAFIAALDVAEGWNDSVRRDFSRRRYDLSVQLAEPQAIGTLERILRALPDVAATEYWAAGSPYLIGAAGVPTVSVSLVGPEPSSTLLALPLLSGRWLEAGDSSAAVINQAVAAREPALRVGGRLRLRVDDRDVTFPIVGVVKELAPMPVIYAPRAAVLAATGRDGSLARTVRIVSRTRGKAGERAAAREVEDAFAREGLEITAIQRMTDTKQAILDHLVIIQSILILASVIVVLVGAIALTSTLSLSVIQRTRELGIMGALGATPRVLAGQVWFEGVAIGLLGWLVANVLAMPLAWALESATGRIFFKAPLDFHVGLTPSLIWLGLTLALASISSAQPAWRAARLTVREALAYA